MAKNKLILAIDFDGTIIEQNWPCTRYDPLPFAIETIKALKKAGHVLILWTAREDEPYNINKRYLTDAVNWCREQGIEWDAVNETIMEHEWRSEKSIKRKPHVDLFIDDRNIGGFVGWEYVGRTILGDQVMDEIIAFCRQPLDQGVAPSGIPSEESVSKI